MKRKRKPRADSQYGEIVPYTLQCFTNLFTTYDLFATFKSVSSVFIF